MARLLAGRTHGTGLYLHLVPAVERWLRAAGDARHVELSFGHDLRATGGFDGDLAWMVDPAAGGEGNFADLGIHLAALLHRLWPQARLREARTELEPAPDGVADAGGRARLAFADGRTATLQVSALRRRPLTLTADVDGVEWRVEGGRLHNGEQLVLDGPEPDAAMAATDFLDRLTGLRRPDAPPPADAGETLRAQRDVALMLGAAG